MIDGGGVRVVSKVEDRSRSKGVGFVRGVVEGKGLDPGGRSLSRVLVFDGAEVNFRMTLFLSFFLPPPLSFVVRVNV